VITLKELLILLNMLRVSIVYTVNVGGEKKTIVYLYAPISLNRLTSTYV